MTLIAWRSDRRKRSMIDTLLLIRYRLDAELDRGKEYVL